MCVAIYSFIFDENDKGKTLTNHKFDGQIYAKIYILKW